jgi:hypothetical protein
MTAICHGHRGDKLETNKQTVIQAKEEAYTRPQSVGEGEIVGDHGQLVV